MTTLTINFENPAHVAITAVVLITIITCFGIGGYQVLSGFEK